MELDWLRILLILGVFLHHVGMPFNGDDWIVMNSESSTFLDDVMVYFEQFRLPTLFLIAGVGANILLGKKRAGAFAADKVKRLLIPLFVGILLVNPPQIYLQDPSEHGSLLGAYPTLALRFETLHLWFVEYLFVFSLLAVPMFVALNSRAGARFMAVFRLVAGQWWGLLSLGLVLAAARVILKLRFPTDDHAIENLSSSVFYLFFFTMGMLLSRNPEIWRSMGRNWRSNAIAFILVSSVFYLYYFMDFGAYASDATLWSIWWAVCSVLAWSAAICLLSLGQRFLTTSPRWLSKVNTLIYPFYILHQTAIVVCAFHIVKWDAGIGIKLVALLASSLSITVFLCLAVIRPFDAMRFLFGLKPKSATRPASQGGPGMDRRHRQADPEGR